MPTGDFDVQIECNGALYIGGAFTTLECDHIVQWNGVAWSAIGDTNAIVTDFAGSLSSAFCGYCGSGVEVIDICPRCGAPPWKERACERGKFLIVQHEEPESSGPSLVSRAWARLRPRRKPVVSFDVVKK